MAELLHVDGRRSPIAISKNDTVQKAQLREAVGGEPALLRPRRRVESDLVLFVLLAYDEATTPRNDQASTIAGVPVFGPAVLMLTEEL